jgi:peptidylprolyl isomerase
MKGMKNSVAALVIVLLGAAVGCSSAEDTSAGGGSARPALTPIPAPPDVAAVPADAQRSASGLAWKVLAPGTGTRHPRPTSTVVAHYTGWTTDGKMFDSSVARGEPLTYPLNKLIPGWIEGMQMMVAGEKRRFWIPGSMAYDNVPDPSAPKGMLVFDIELLEVR